MAYTNSPLATYKNLAPRRNYYGNRTHAIDRITPHCVATEWSIEMIGKCFANPNRRASCNYGIGKDGRIGLICEEKNASGCSSNQPNDERAVTIECSCSPVAPYKFRDVVYERLIDLCTDICKRNGKAKLLWLGSKEKALSYVPKKDEMVLTAHRFFSNKSCPGEWCYSRFGDLANKVTARLSSSSSSAPSSSKEEMTKPSNETVYNGLFRVQVGAFRLKANADKYLKEVKAKGFDGFVTKVGSYYKVQVGAFSKKANADAMLAKVKKAGFKNAYVTTDTKKKSVDEVAREVIAGKWGTGSTRKTALEAAGYDYAAVQKKVNELL